MASPLSVLLIEDSEDDALLLIRELRRGGYDPTFERVETAPAMRVALEGSAWDIVLSDHDLPQFNATAALAVLQESGLDLPFIIVSGAIGEEVAVTAMKAGAHDYIIKGNLARLVPAIERELREAEVRREHRRDEEALRDSEARNRAILTAAPDGVITFDEKGLIGSFNPAAEKIFGMTASEAIGRGVGSLMSASHARRFHGFLHWYLHTGEKEVFALSREASGRRKDGRTFPMDMAVSETRLEGRRIFTGIIRDLTDQKAMEAQMHRAQKMETIGILASGIAHDFGNLLTTLQGNLTLALTGMKPGDPGFHHLSLVGQAADRAADLVARLRTLSHRLPTDKKALNLHEEIETAVELLRGSVPVAIEIETQFTPEFATIEADPTLIQDVVLNLCLNARDAMPEGGRLTLGLEHVLLEAGHPDLDADAAPGEYACISVRDTGHGIPEEVKGRIFEPFFTTKEKGKGTGLGLAMVQRIIEEHEGFINFESEEGRGTTFWVYLPVVLSRGRISKARGLDGALGGNGECILVADDDFEVLEVVEQILRATGYDVITASNGREAVERFRSERNRIDLVLLDVVMPGTSGRNAFFQIRKLGPDVKVLFASGNRVDIPEAVEAAGAAFIQKPYSISELLRGIHQMLNRP